MTTSPSLLDEPSVFARSFQDSNDTIIITDTQGRIVAANPAWLDLYGYNIDEVRGQSTRLIKSRHSDDEMYRYMWSQIRQLDKGYWKGEIVNQKKSGEEVPILLSITPIRKDDAIVGYMGVGIDLTERKQYEQLKELYDMVVRHDLRAPLGSILALVDTLVKGFAGELAPRQAEMLARIESQARRMLAIIDTSLDLEQLKRRTIRLDLEPLDLFAVLRASFQTLEPMAAQRQVSLLLYRGKRPATAEDRLTLLLDPVHLQRCTDNLVKNAIESSPRAQAVVTTIDESEGRVRIAVSNSGDPIPPDVRATLFHPFSTYGKKGGTGLGLYGVKLTVEAMGGEVGYTTGESGTTFELLFPDGS